MISVHEAREIIRQQAQLLAPHSTSLQDAFGSVLAEDVFAKVSVPGFNQSGVDGYAFRFYDLQQTNTLAIAGEVAAGDKGDLEIRSGSAVRVFTGAPIPIGLDTVVMQEKTEIREGKVVLKDVILKKGDNLRPEGSDIKNEELALSANSLLTPAAIGFLAGCGLSELAVYPQPSVHIIVTGKELQAPGLPLLAAQVYESNSVMLEAALDQLRIRKRAVTTTGDNKDEIQQAMIAALASADLVLLTGGVSVGDYDFVVKAAEASGVRPLFHGVAQRPGKPLYAGLKEGKLLFGLPGNPASVLTCFYNYVVLAIEEMTGRKNLLERKEVSLLADVDKKIRLRQFLKGDYTGESVLPLAGQESFRLSSFAAANCLIELPEEPGFFQKGEPVEILLLPYL